MQLVSYDYYCNNYNGTRFSDEASFNVAERKAELILSKYITIPSEPSDNIKMCICSLSDYTDKMSEIEDKISRGIYSERVSGYSISYGSLTERRRSMSDGIMEILELWLGNDYSNLGYRGVSRHVL